MRTTALPSRLLLAAALFSAGACLPLSLSARELVDIDVVDRDSGQWLPEYRHRGDTWIAGAPGHRYGVRLTNNSGERVLVVLSVDGVNAVSGRTAHPSQTGYVLGPWQSTQVDGWRKSLDDVAQFVFTDLPDSYAARTGRPDNVGVIGIAVFRERRAEPAYPVAPPMVEERMSKARAGNAPAAARESAAATQSLGTGHGQRQWSPVSQTAFERASSAPQQVTQLRYDAAERLVALGVLPRWRPPYVRAPEPRAFPGAFVPDPPGG